MTTRTARQSSIAPGRVVLLENKLYKMRGGKAVVNHTVTRLVCYLEGRTLKSPQMLSGWERKAVKFKTYHLKIF